MTFERTDLKKYKRFSRKKENHKWRKARGRHSKIREGIRGKPVRVKVGFKGRREEADKIRGKIPIMIRNLRDAEKVGKETLVIIAKLGKRKRLGIEKKIKEKGGEILNTK